MGKILVDRSKVEKIKQLPLIGRGKEGSCYYLGNGEVVKIFYYFNTHRNLYFDDRIHSQIAYPKQILIDKECNLPTGYTMPRLKGQKFVHGFSKNLTLEELKQAYLNLRLVLLRERNIYTDDNCLDNMLYDYDLNKINMIDTSRWYPKQDGHMESICNFNFQMMNAILKVYNFNNNKVKRTKYIQELYQLYEEYYQYYGTDFLNKHMDKSLFNFSNIFLEFLKELDQMVSDYRNDKVKTINDISIW